MKFALINGERQEAQPNLSGQCPVCDQAMIAKCGKVKIWHWAHKGRRTCDLWWENETEWHRAWKGKFPESWQEVIHRADNGEKHVADVRTDQGWVIEFQHSIITPEERRSRDTFYKKLVWVVDGTKRKRDGAQFLNALKSGIPIGSNSLVRKTISDKCVILGEWVDSHSPVFFDFGGEQVLWWILKRTPDGSAYVAPISRSDFIEIHRGGATQKARDFEDLVKDLSNLVTQYELHLRGQVLKQAPLPLPTQVFQHYQMRRSSPRRRF
jgi:competence protein CoiA